MVFKKEQTPIKKKMRESINHKTIKQIAGENIKLDDIELDKQLAKKMIFQYLFPIEFQKQVPKLF